MSKVFIAPDLRRKHFPLAHMGPLGIPIGVYTLHNDDYSDPFIKVPVDKFDVWEVPLSALEEGDYRFLTEEEHTWYELLYG